MIRPVFAGWASAHAVVPCEHGVGQGPPYATFDDAAKEDPVHDLRLARAVATVALATGAQAKPTPDYTFTQSFDQGCSHTGISTAPT